MGTDLSSGCPAPACASGEPCAGGTPPVLPTLQRNALCKIFGRADFSPEEVAALGHRRLQQAEGIGSKGLATIIHWLAAHGQPLTATRTGKFRPTPRSCGNQDVERAIKLLRQRGYTVLKKSEPA